MTLSHDFAPQFALPRAEQALPARALGKLSRLLAQAAIDRLVVAGDLVFVDASQPATEQSAFDVVESRRARAVRLPRSRLVTAWRKLEHDELLALCLRRNEGKRRGK